MSLQLRVCIDVDDLDKGIAFYTRALGLTVGRRLGKNWAELLGAQVPVDLLAEKPGTAPIPVAGSLRDYRRHWTPVHLDWPVAELDAAVGRAQAAGATLEGGSAPRATGVDRCSPCARPWFSRRG